MASAVSQLQAARSAPRLWHSSMDTIVPQECVGVYMQAMIARSRCVLVRICISVPYGRRTELA